MPDHAASPELRKPGRRRSLAIGIGAGLSAVLLLGVAAVALGPRADPEATYEEALAALEAGRFDQSEAAMARLASQRAPTTLDWGVRARLALARGRTDEALDALAKIPETHPLSSWAMLRVGQIESRRRRFRFAEAALRRALDRDPGLVEARRALIYILGIQLRRADLHSQFALLAESAPLTPREVWVWGMSHDLAVWTPGEHAEILEDALRADPDDRWSRLSLAENQRRQAHYAEAEATLAPLPPSDPDALAALASIALDTKGPEAAAALLADAPADDPRLALIRGRLALGTGRAVEAVRFFESALAADPDLRRSRSDLGHALLAAGRPGDAEPHLKAARAIDALNTALRNADEHLKTPDPDLWRRLAAASEAAGRIAEARAWYRLVISRDPLDADAQRALFRLAPAASDDRSAGRNSRPI